MDKDKSIPSENLPDTNRYAFKNPLPLTVVCSNTLASSPTGAGKR